ncbi:MAG: FAD:protein FMN transferase ApbE [Gammaproteobacteria bacterium]|nr:MAG: FAD:protein FMN transferase ApbE [Gammaproteobacteria bacterium]
MNFLIRRDTSGSLPLCAIVCALALSACTGDTPTPKKLTFRGQTMGTTYQVTVAHQPADTDQATIGQEIAAVLARIEGRMSTYRPESELSRFNRDELTQWIPLSAETVTVVTAAQKISGLSDGAFDITVAPLVNLWGFGPRPRPAEPPAAEEVTAALARVGYQRLAVRQSPPALRKQHGTLSVDLSAIAKGYAVDQVAEALARRGLKHVLVDVGGELRALGNNPEGVPWRIAIETPDARRGKFQRTLVATNVGVATSGDYRNYFERDGRRYSHTIDPRSGRPIEHRLASVTVVAKSAMQADGLATALLVMGAEQGQQLAAREGIAALFIVRHADGFRELHTPALKNYLLPKK